MDLERTSAPAALLTVADVKAHLRKDHDFENTLFAALIMVVSPLIDGRYGYLQGAANLQTWKLRLPYFPSCRRLELPLAPLSSVVSVKYFDASNVEQTVSASDYQINTRVVPGFIELQPVATWPATYERIDAVTIEFIAGYAADAPELATIKQAALLLIGDYYVQRGDGGGGDGGMTQFQLNATGIRNPTVLALLDPFRHTWLG